MCCSAPLGPCPSVPWLEVGLLPPMTSVNNGSGVVRVCDSTVAGDAVGAAGLGAGAGTGTGTGAAAVAGAEGAVDVGAVDVGAVDVGVGAADAVDVGGGAGSARAGESVAAVSDARVTTNAVSSAVVFRIEFTFCLS